MEPGFPDYAGQEERAELVGDFATAAATVLAIVNMGDILHGTGQGPKVVPGVLK